MEENVTGVTLGKRHKQSPGRGDFFLDVVAVSVDNANDLNVVRRTILRWNCIADMLTDCIFVWKKFLRHKFIDDADLPPILVFAFGLDEIPPPQNLNPDRFEISGRGRGPERAGAGIRRFRVVRQCRSCRHDPARVSEISVWQHRPDADGFDAGKFASTLDDIEDFAARINWLLFYQSEIHFCHK